jgi:hypothetical protein
VSGSLGWEKRTFEELATVHLAGGNLESNDMTLLKSRVSKYSLADLPLELVYEKAGCVN